MDETSETRKPSSDNLRVTIKVFMWLSILPVLLGLFLIQEDLERSDDMLNGIGYFLGGILIAVTAWALFCYRTANRRVTFHAQMIWFLLSFAPAFILVAGSMVSRAIFSSVGAP